MRKYLSYFYYLAVNWNLFIAFHIIRKEIKGEKFYNINTTGADELEELSDSGIDTTHATIYMPASYDLLEDVMAHSEIKAKKHFVDIGCGKGRSMAVAAFHGFRKVTGVDFSRPFCEAAKKNMLAVKDHFPDMDFNVLNNDAFYFEIPPDADCIFLFNPFDEIIMSGVVKNINNSIRKFPRDVCIIYFNPVNKVLFTDSSFQEIYYSKKLNYLEASILKKVP